MAGKQELNAPRCDMLDDILLDSAPIKFLVGPAQQSSHAHEQIIPSHSAFFDAALKEGWKEAQEHKFRLPKEDPETFRTYLLRTYKGQIIGMTSGRAHGDLNRASCMNLVKDFWIADSKRVVSTP